MAPRASIILWSAGSGVLLGLFIDATLVGICLVATSIVPVMVPREPPRWLAAVATLVLVAVPIAVGVLGYLEGRLKVL